ncbi:hypothetical protein ACTQ4K_10135 [Clostridium sporogenes]|uniref:hypothetical protein n=1 Tax=Clostridium sporogenes TaxID=1509 RepID=UPI003F8E759D
MNKKKRLNISQKQRKRLLEKNANVCCVCKKRGIGVNLHHLDEDPSNNNDDNIAVLCVKEHDCHHRPNTYPALEHLDLSTEELKNKKKSWESFVSEAKDEKSNSCATITVYGTIENISGMKIVFHWQNGRIEFERVYQLLDGPMEKWVDWAFDEIKWIGKNIKVFLIDSPVSIEYCDECAGGALSRVVDENIIIKENADDWKSQSICTIYINPTNTSLAYTIFYRENLIYQASIHKCGGEFHFVDGKTEERYKFYKRKVRSQLHKLINEKISHWEVDNIIIGTGNSNNPDIISELKLPRIWEEYS